LHLTEETANPGFDRLGENTFFTCPYNHQPAAFGKEKEFIALIYTLSMTVVRSF
jgi:hypothetical protein